MNAEVATIYPLAHNAPPVQGNFTTTAEMHLWCANALSAVLSDPEAALEEWNDDIQAALRYLLHCEVERAMHAQRAE